MNYRAYKDLHCYLETKLLRIFISKLAKFPSHEKFLLTSQIIDSSRSMEHFTTAFDEKYITEESKNGEQCEVVFKLINGYIFYFQKAEKHTKGLTPNFQSQITNSSRWQLLATNTLHLV